MPPLDATSRANGTPIGLIAGQGSLPIETARGLRAAGHRVICCALEGQTRKAELKPLCDVFNVVGLIRMNQWIRVLKRHGCSEAVMVGRVGKSEVYERWHLFRYLPDWRTARVWFVRLKHDKRNDAILRAVADELAAGGLHLIDGRPYVPDSLAAEGVMTKTQPSKSLAADIDFAWPLLKRVNELLIGQAVACKAHEILAVEAVEGTDALIERAGKLCKRGSWLLCKAANPNQDMRFDVPTIGLQTIENLHAHGGAGLVVETNRVIMLDKEQLLARADQLGLVIVGRT